MRFRPIMMTTTAALLGGLPMALGQGVGSGASRPLGIAIVGGPGTEPNADAVYDAGDLSLSRQAAVALGALAWQGASAFHAGGGVAA